MLKYIIKLFLFVCFIGCIKQDYKYNITDKDSISIIIDTIKKDTSKMATYYVATDGNDGNAGTIGSPWATWQKGFSTISAGDTLYIRGGTYSPSATLGSGDGGTLYCGVYVSNKNGNSSSQYTVSNYGTEVPIMDGTTLNGTSYGRVGILLNNCSYWHIKGLQITNVTQSSGPVHGGIGVHLYGTNNILLENIACHHIGGPGFMTRVPNGNENHFLNCDAHDNYDQYTTDPVGGDADGFDIGFARYGGGDYIIRLTGCRSWNNSDDGFDMYQYPGYSGIYYLTNCWAWHNGYRSDGVSTAGDGCGFKYGADDLDNYSITRRYSYNCIAYDNRTRGFSQESAQVKKELYNCISYENNDWGFSFYGYDIPDIVRNCVAFGDGVESIGSSRVHDHNSWDLSVTVTTADFKSVTGSLLASARQANGDLPVIDFLHLATGSDLIGVGTNAGLSTDGDGQAWASPRSIGAFEYSTGVITLEYRGETYTNSTTGDWSGVDIPRDEPTNFSFIDNSITSVNQSGYMLHAGNDAGDSTDNNLDGEIIRGNRLTWNGSGTESITHGIFTGHMIDVEIKYNYLDKVPMAIIRKSTYPMSNNSGGVSYNIIKNPIATAGVIKGMNNVAFYNNTIYSSLSGPWRGLIDIYSNDDVTPKIAAEGAKIKNNIFFTSHQLYNIAIHDASCLPGFESDYNLFWCSDGTPHFNYLEEDKTFAQWQALGYDTHSVVINPSFNNTTDFIPSTRLNYGTNLGSEFATGLATTATWVVDIDPSLTTQDANWQVGARVFEGEIPDNATIPQVTTSAITGISYFSASGGGNVIHDGSLNVTAKGVCWNTSINPTVANSNTNDGTGEGSFSSYISGLNSSTHYYARAYATNSLGTGYGDNVQFDTSLYIGPIVEFSIGRYSNKYIIYQNKYIILQ